MQTRFESARFPILILALGAFLVSNRSVSAARLVRFDVSIDGKTVLRASSGDNGSPDADKVWRNLERLSLRPFSAKDIFGRDAKVLVPGYEIEPDSDEPLHATLKGRVVIDATYGGRAVVAELKLVREKQDSPWKLAPAEVERTFKIRHKPFAFGISMDGENVLYSLQETTTGDHAEDVETVWRQLKHMDFRPNNAAKGKGPQYQIQADSDDPKRGTLQGNIVVRLSYGGHPWGQAKVSKLKFVRSKTAAWRWTLDPVQAELTPERHEKSE